MQILNQDEVMRYARHFSVKAIGVEGQKKLKHSKVLLVGAGGIGSPAAIYLTASGVGNLTIIDHDHVDLSNLQRQIIYQETDCGKLKAECAKSRLEALNHHTNITIHTERLESHNALEFIEGFDCVIDGTDNYPTRYLVSDVCAIKGIPLISASIYQFSGQLGLYNHNGSPCYRCVYPEPPPAGLIPNCAEAGVLGVLPGILATLATNEALKLLLGFEMKPKIIQFDGIDCQTSHFPVAKGEHCPICAERINFEELERFIPNKEAKMNIEEIDCQTLANWQSGKKAFVLLDVRQEWERQICKIEPSIHIPLDQLEKHLSDFNIEDTIVLQCRSGVRSLHAAEIMSKHGYKHTLNLKGGILAWGQSQDTTMTRY